MSMKDISRRPNFDDLFLFLNALHLIAMVWPFSSNFKIFIIPWKPEYVKSQLLSTEFFEQCFIEIYKHA